MRGADSGLEGYRSPKTIEWRLATLDGKARAGFLAERLKSTYWALLQPSCAGASITSGYPRLMRRPVSNGRAFVMYARAAPLDENFFRILLHPASSLLRNASAGHELSRPELTEEVMKTIGFSRIAAALLLATTLSARAGEAPTDPQIAHIAYTAGTVDIEYAEIALQRSKNKAVREFATEMVRDHKAVNDKALALVKKLGVTPEDNETSQTLAKQATEKRSELMQLSGAAFDRAYAENEVSYHAFVNNAVDKLLIPSAANDELKGLLKVGLKIFRGHQQHAEHMVQKLGHMSGSWKTTVSKE
jgi:putative membrane protein